MDTDNKTSPKLQITTASGQLQGGRWRQEDSVLLRASAHGRIAFVADGVGGHVRGDEASATAVTVATDGLKAYIEQAADVPDDPLTEAFVQAHAAVSLLPAGRRAPAATTLIGGLFRVEPAVAWLANVGDSLAFLLRDGETSTIFVPQGVGNWVRYALGYDIGYASEGIEICRMELSTGDRFLLASDGLLTLDYDNIQEALLQDTPRACCEQLLSQVIAAARPNQDNCTVLALFVEETP